MPFSPASTRSNTGLRLRHLAVCLALASLAPAAWAGPWVEVGRSDLRSDILILADAGVITGPVSTWPLSWGDISSDLELFSGALEPFEEDALARVRKAAGREMVLDSLVGHARIAVSEEPVQIRSFESTPREDAEVELGVSWTGDRFAAKLQGSWVDNPVDGEEWRLDGSYLGVALGNWTLAASAQDRWWGPGWQGSMALSSNARPFPALSLERNSTKAFNSKWLSWLGPWDFTLMSGFLEKDREIPNAKFLGARFNFRPLKGLEIGINRTAIWCGDGRPCSLQTFTDLFLGRDNAGENVDPEDEPGNQLAGWDIRWSSKLFKQPYALYTHWSGEDQEAYHPSKYSGQFGAETWGRLGADNTYRVFLEWADTECNFSRSFNGDPKPNCTYNSGLYKTGYRYEGRSIAHSFDNDSRVLALGGIVSDVNANSWQTRIAYGKLNRAGGPDIRNTVAQVKHDFWEASVGHRRSFTFGDINVGAGYEYRKIRVTDVDDTDPRFWLEWTYKTY